MDKITGAMVVRVWTNLWREDMQDMRGQRGPRVHGTSTLVEME